MAALFFIGYLIGSIPFGLILSKLAGHGDIRAIGSGNIGATNVLRTGSKKLAVLTLLLDIGKGAMPALFMVYMFSTPDPAIPNNFGQLASLSIGSGAIMGHCFPIWLKFKGGKGVATTLGVLLAAVPYAGLAACATWLAVVFIFKISSLAALTGLLIAPIVTYFIYGSFPALVAFCITLLVFWRHKENIQRLMKGEEPKISFGKSKAS